MGNWKRELNTFSPSLNVLTYHGFNREFSTNCDVILTTYAILRIDLEKFQKNNWDLLIIDEAQNIKNPSTSQTQAIKAIKAQMKVAMTGTPVENRLSELWSIFDYIMPGYLFGYKKFKTQAELVTAITVLFEEKLLPLIEKGLCGSIYTQVSDVEDEINGLYTYDRAVCKVDKEKMRLIMEEAQEILRKAVEG